MPTNQIISHLEQIMSSLLFICEYEQDAIKQKTFENINLYQNDHRALIKEAEELEKALSKRIDLKNSISEKKKDQISKINKKLFNVLEKNRIDTLKIISINQLAIRAISSAIAQQKKFEFGYDHCGLFPQTSVIKKNTLPLNLNEKC